METNATRPEGWRQRLHEIIFEADTFAGRLFDMALMLCILASVLVVILDSVPHLHRFHGRELVLAEWFFTLLFTVEYLLRLLCVRVPSAYALSFFGVIDLLAILPTYLSLFLPGAQFLMVIRLLRVLRIFRVLKLVQYLAEAKVLGESLWNTRRKITIFLFTVLVLVVIFGSLMYLVEGEANGFENIPLSIYWAIVTLTTVGYGDISPKTGLGQALASFIMVLGYAILAVPTGIVTAELALSSKRQVTTQACPDCCAEGHDADAKFCKYCGGRL